MNELIYGQDATLEDLYILGSLGYSLIVGDGEIKEIEVPGNNG